MNRVELAGILPHRDQMLLLDEAWLEGSVAHGRYLVRGDEWFLQGHFPGDPVTPGVVICEILAQSACVLLADCAAGHTTYLTGLDKVRFRRPLRPGELLETECSILKAKPPFYFAAGRGSVAGQLCLQAEFSFMLAHTPEEQHG